MMARNLVIFRRRPFSTTMTRSFSAFVQQSLQVLGTRWAAPRIAGLAFLETAVRGRLAKAHRVIALILRRHWRPPRSDDKQSLNWVASYAREISTSPIPQLLHSY